MGRVVLGLREVGRQDLAAVGGKGANLGELSRLDGIRVPDGFCLTAAVFERILEALPIDGMRDEAAAIRHAVESVPVPADVREAVAAELARLGEHDAWAVRSSATAEDLPDASFAGQQDTFLDVVGLEAVLVHVRRCWASSFSDRAVAYRERHGFDHGQVRMAVVVQRMVRADAAGVLFTADPVSGNRTVTVIEAVAGLGEALVSGRATPDRHTVRDDRVTDETLATPPRATLRDAQVVVLAKLGRRIEAHFGAPQDVEWCLAGGAFSIVQSRPITTLFPIPDAGEGEHVFLSVGHQQMMTDAMKPLGWSLFQTTAGRPMFPAAGRLFVDVTKELSSPAIRPAFVAGFLRSDPLTGDALRACAARYAVVTPPPEAAPPPPPPAVEIEDDPAIVAELITRDEEAVATLEREIRSHTGTALMDFISATLVGMKQGVFDRRSFAVILAGMSAANWLNDHLAEWLGEKNAADTLALSVPDNVTSEMGLALLDVADVVRSHPEVVAYLREASDDGFLDGLLAVEGGEETHAVLGAFLDRFGMRCVGEIDVTRPRWAEAPTTLVPLILGSVDHLAPGAGGRRFEQGRRAAADKERELVERLKRLPDGERKAADTERMVRRLRRFAGYREYPKYGIVRRYFLFKQALRAEAERLVGAGVLDDATDIDFLTFPELREVVRTHEIEPGLVWRRRVEHEHHRKLTPPRVITSDGEVMRGAYQRSDVPPGALVGLAVSSGVVEGRARVLANLADAELREGDILVTAFTDPSWTPAFLAIRGLVTEVGGLMTHGAVVAREYGLPAVVGVENATRSIADGQRIRVNGTDGFVELLG